VAGELPEYTAWLRNRPCAACRTRLMVEVHHATNGDTVAPGDPRPPKSTGTRRGKGQKAHDYYTIPLCFWCHANFHSMRGEFAGWDKAKRNLWQLHEVGRHRLAYEGDR